MPIPALPLLLGAVAFLVGSSSSRPSGPRSAPLPQPERASGPLPDSAFGPRIASVPLELPARTGREFTMREPFHLRPTATAASVGPILPAGTVVQVGAPTEITRPMPQGLERLFAVQLRDGRSGFAFLPPDAVPQFAPQFAGGSYTYAPTFQGTTTDRRAAAEALREYLRTHTGSRRQRSVVAHYQAQIGTTPDGLDGPNTQAAIAQALAQPYQQEPQPFGFQGGGPVEQAKGAQGGGLYTPAGGFGKETF